ncbi:restriction endonuclease subunit S [Dyadobacter tibetensis]|uniref:restriction endonuclease subunit S n=1 Tax=Dyadobacter tibetensis TaxID=1211851 RepID=UPI0004726512|nr:restriction endonuclease subunit S [Dyadobacter tibetensis]
MEKLQPELRFPEFNGDWEQRAVGSVCNFIVPGRNKPTKFDGNIPWITTPDIKHNSIVYFSKSNLAISLDEAKDVGSKVVPKDSVIISCVGELGLVAISGTEMVINQQLHAFIPKHEVNYRFLLYALTVQKPYMDKVATKTAVPYMNKTNCNSIPVIFPTLPEQTKIAEFLTAVDKRIELLTAKKEKLTLYKKGVMQKIFNQELRFKIDNGHGELVEPPEWEERRLGEVCHYFSKRNKKLIKAEVYSVTNSNGFVLQSEQFEDRKIAGNDLSNYKIVEKNSFAYNPARINVGSIAQFEDEIGLISSLYVCFNVSDKLLDKFLLIFLDLESTKKSIVDYGEGGVRVYLWYNLFSLIPIRLPSIAEQRKIAEFSSSIDAQIQKVEQQITLNQKYKKGLLQKMFV